MVILLFVLAEVEYRVLLAQLLVVYSHISHIADADAESFTEFVAMSDTLMLIDGAERSNLSRETVCSAVIVPIDVPEYVPLNRQEAPR